MPITPTYPGVYVEEIPSGVRTITGVATSITAFIGHAKRGPVNKAVRILGFADYERRFGGLDKASEMSYAVRQFFTNGGSEAFVVRVAGNPTTAAEAFLANTPKGNVLKVTAVDAGFGGRNIRLLADHGTSNPASTFNLTVLYSSPDEPGGDVIERFENLSMNSKDPRWVERVINGASKLVTIQRVIAPGAITAKGSSISGEIKIPPTDFGIDATHNQFRVSVDGGDPIAVVLVPPFADGTALKNAVQAALGAGVTVTFASDHLTIESAAAGEFSSVHVLPGLANDASMTLKLGPLNGGVERDAATDIRPDEVPLHGTLVSGAIATPANIKNKKSLQISVDGSAPAAIEADTGAAGITDPVGYAGQLQTKISTLNLASEAFRNFTVKWDAANNKFILKSGTRGKGSSVVVFVGSDTLATDLKLTGGNGEVRTDGVDKNLTGGSETPFDPTSNPFPVVIASRTNRTGLFALEEVDLFNILCIPAVSDGPTLAEAAAYCQERRAFLIADPPPNLAPDAMETLVKGPTIPKTNYGAIYYPWIKIADENGKLRVSAPSGTIAGVYARTDAARGVWKAPAGTDASLVGVQAVEYPLTDRENGILNPRGVNCNRIFPTYGAVAWGARTLQGDNNFASEWKYVPVRRIALFIEESLYRGTQWVVFEPNDEPLWSQIRLNVGAFMQNLFRQGAFQGRTPREAYLVKCDKETTTQNDINLGIVNILVGFAPLKPAEFVFLKISQLAGQIQV